MKHPLAALLLLLTLCGTAPAQAKDTQDPRYGLATLHGTAYDPEHISLSIVQGFVLLDYDQVFWHQAPDPLRLKLEGNLGMTTDGRARSLASINMLALYYLEPLARRWRPYGEAGIGLIYTDFHVKDQGLHLNFNPQFGAGLEYALNQKQALLGGFRFHHISNGNLHDHNRGINSWLLMLGLKF